jgi:hypothetical protein
MTYSEAYQKAETPQELIDAVRHDVSVWALYGRNPDRLKAITTAMNKTAKEKDWNLVRITKCVEMRTGEALEVNEDAGTD